MMAWHMGITPLGIPWHKYSDTHPQPRSYKQEYSEPSVASTLSRERGDISRILFSLDFKNQKNSIPAFLKEEEVFDLIGIVST